MSDLPRIWHVVISLEFGGLERLVVDWTNARNRRQPGSTAICCLDAPGALAPLVEGGAVVALQASRGRFPCDLAALRTLRRLALRTAGGCGRAADLLHSHNLAPQQYAALARLGTRLRHIHTEHGTNPHAGSLVHRLRNRLLFAATDRYVAVSNHTADSLTAVQRLPRHGLVVIPNGVSAAPPGGVPASVRGAVRAELDIAPDAAVLGAVGRLAWIKGHDRLLQAFAALVRQRAVAGARVPVLVLVGDGPARAALESQAGALAIRERVVFTGYRVDGRRLLAALDLFVLPSRSEGLSVALLEAMADGVPVAATDAGENRVVMGDTGSPLPVDEEAWTAILGDALDASVAQAPAFRRRLAEARRRVAEAFSLEGSLAAYERLYAEVLTHGR